MFAGIKNYNAFHLNSQRML